MALLVRFWLTGVVMTNSDKSLAGRAERLPDRSPVPEKCNADAAGISTSAGFLSGVVSARRLARLGLPLVALLVACLLWITGSELTFQDDAAQYLSTAHHLLAGDGLRTSVMYYDSQLNQQAPAVQTVWPAGLPVLIAAVVWLTGLTLTQALLLITVSAHLGTAVMLMLAVRLIGMNRWLMLACGLFWLVFVPSWLSVSRGLSDPLYQFCGVMSVVAVACYFEPWLDARTPNRGRGGQGWLLLASLAVMLAISVRYQAISLLVPLFVAMTIGRFSIESGWRRAASGLLVSLAPLCLVGLMFFRNFLVTDSLTGGAIAPRGQTLHEIAARIGWVPEWMQLPLLVTLILSALACALASAMLWVRAAVPAPHPRQSELHPASRAVLVYCLGAYAANITLLLYLCLTSTAYVIAMRYMGMCLLLLMPPVVFLLSRAWTEWVSRWSDDPALLVTGQWLVAAGIAALSLVQLWVLQPTYLARLESAPPARLHQALLAQLVNGAPAETFLLKERVDGKRPVLMSTHAHALNLLTGGTVVGVPVPIYTPRAWTEEEIHALAIRHDVTFVVAFRELDTWVYRDLINKMLDENHCPSWLEPLVANSQLFIGRVRPADLHHRGSTIHRDNCPATARAGQGIGINPTAPATTW